MYAMAERDPGHAANFAVAQQALGFVTWIWNGFGDHAQWFGDLSSLLGLPAGTFSGSYKEYQRCLHPDDVLASCRTLKECVKGIRPEYRTEERVIWPDGSEHWLETYGRGAYGVDGRALGVSGVVRDVTDRKRAAEALAELNASLERRVRERTAALDSANRELESFSHSVSHELRAPLFQIGAFASLLLADRDSSLSADAIHSLERIEQGATRMGQLLESLLEFSRAGRTALRHDAVNMRALVSEALTMLRGKGAERAEVQVMDLPTVRGDEVLLRQVWQNLLGNALKFSRHAASPRVEVGAERRDGAVDFYVRDNGAGFDMQQADKLFRVFERLHPAEQFEGTGAGLSIVKRIIERHGGQVAAAGEPGCGATFRFSLPA